MSSSGGGMINGTRRVLDIAVQDIFDFGNEPPRCNAANLGPVVERCDDRPDSFRGLAE